MTMKIEYAAKQKFDSKHLHELRAVDFDHTPFNKRRFEVKGSTAILKAVSCTPNDNNAGWLELSLEEITTSHKGAVQGRTISVSLDAATKAALRALLALDDDAEAAVAEEASRRAEG